MKLLWTEQGWADYTYWQDSDRKILGRFNDLVKDMARNPFGGI